MDCEPMTDEQKNIVIGVLQSGWVCGLSHPYECITNADRAFYHFMPFETIADKRAKLYDAFVAFFNNARGPNEPLLTARSLLERISMYYVSGANY